MIGGGSSNTVTKYNAMQIQTSLLGVGVTLGWGRNKIGGSLIDYVGFRAVKSQSSGGKGLGGGGSEGYDYYASIIELLCEGPILGVRAVYKDSTVYKDGATTGLAQAGLSLALGDVDQAAWGFMVSSFPDHALGYSSLAYVYAYDYALGSSGSVPNHNFEVDFAIQHTADGDANPRDIVQDYLENPSYGVSGWPSGMLSTPHWDNYSDHCRAWGLFLSPVIEGSSSTTGADFLKQVMEETNSEIFLSEGLLKVKPYTDGSSTGDGVTWTPDLTPVYDITEDDLLDDPDMDIRDQLETKNYWTVEYLDRTNEYQPAIATAQDLDNIITHQLRPSSPDSYHHICVAEIARTVSQFRLQRSLYLRDSYTLKLPEDFVLLEPMDYVTVTTLLDGLLLSRQLMIVTSIDEDDGGEGDLTVSVEEVPGTASVATYPAHSADGTRSQAAADPGDVTDPLLFNPPPGLLVVDGEVWLAASGVGDNWGGCQVWVAVPGGSYQYLGDVVGRARYGVLTSSLPLVADPDNTSSPGIDLSNSLGQLSTVTSDEANAGATLSWINGELIGYEVATLTASYNYDLSTLRRGLYGTAPAAHSVGESFVRLDNSLFKFNYKSLNVGDTLDVKLPSFNLYGKQLQDLSSLTPYSVTLSSLPGILATSVAPGSITTPSLDTNAVTDSVTDTPVSSYTGTTAFVTVASVTISPMRSSQVDISADATQTYSSGTKDWGFRILVDGVVVKEFSYGTGRTSLTDIITISKLGVSVTSGTHTISLEWEGEDSTLSLDNIELSAVIRLA